MIFQDLSNEILSLKIGSAISENGAFCGSPLFRLLHPLLLQFIDLHVVSVLARFARSNNNAFK